jgi:hypothetical protein
MNSAEWILSFDGIAVQVLNFETNFFTTKSGSATINYIKDDSVRLLIPGYHFDGSLEAADVNKNRIYILAGDGSVITLVNSASNSYDGDYIYEGKDFHYIAKVNYI